MEQSTASQEPLIGGRYRVRSLLGRGGMGAVRHAGIVKVFEYGLDGEAAIAGLQPESEDAVIRGSLVNGHA